MKTVFTLLILFAGFLFQTDIDTENSQITFIFESEDVQGSIGDIESQSEIDINNLENSTVKGSVSVTSLKTGNFLRDGHLMWEKYFNRTEHPRLYFESTAISATANDKYVVKGNLTMKGIVKPVVFSAVRKGQSIAINGDIYTSDWGIKISELRLENKVTIAMIFKLN